jgi:uncharacterized membrane protein
VTTGRLRAASPYLLAAFFVGAGAAHFTATDTYARIIPHGFPASSRRPLVQISGIAEIACAALIAVPRTRRVGALGAAVLLVSVFPANMQMAADGGIAGAGFPLGSPVVAWLRLPLQLPLIAWTISVAQARMPTGRAGARIV